MIPNNKKIVNLKTFPLKLNVFQHSELEPFWKKLLLKFMWFCHRNKVRCVANFEKNRKCMVEMTWFKLCKVK